VSALIGIESPLGGEYVVGVLAEPRRPGLGALGDVRHLDRVPGNEYRLLHPVGARDLDEHVASGDVRVLDDVLVTEARAGGHPDGGERIAHLDLALVAGPGGDGRTEDVVEGGDPPLTVGEARL